MAGVDQTVRSRCSTRQRHRLHRQPQPTQPSRWRRRRRLMVRCPCLGRLTAINNVFHLGFIHTNIQVPQPILQSGSYSSRFLVLTALAPELHIYKLIIKKMENWDKNFVIPFHIFLFLFNLTFLFDFLIWIKRKNEAKFGY